MGWKISLVVSLGPVPEDPGARPQTQVPDVAGLTLAAATARLINASLRVGLVSNERSQEVPAGQVIGETCRRRTPRCRSAVRVNLVVSFGPHAYTLLSGPAYVTNYAGGTVSIVNPDSNQVADNIPSGINNLGPSGIAVSPDGTRLYVANRPRFPRTNGTVSVIDLTERRVIAVIPVGVAPLGVAINPTGERVFVTNEGSFSLSVIDTSTNQPFIDMNVPNLANLNISTNPYPRGVATHPNPLIPLVYVTNRTVNSFSDDEANPQPDQCDALVARPPINVNPDQCVGSMSIFDADLKTQVGSVAVGWAPEGVAVHPDGALIYVANSGDRTVSVIETVFNRVIGIIALDEFGGAPQPWCRAASRSARTATGCMSPTAPATGCS
ncbi:MAG: YncE family protein [Chromatiales bacterium]|nr:YncE family protein [Chromatiales bacterium]